MKIYVGHSSSFDYDSELYKPLKSSKLWGEHTFLLPHDVKKEPTESKDIIANCNLLIAEVSYPSTGLGIELGWANVAGCEILCLYKETSKLSSSLNIVCSNFISYSDPKSMIDKLEQWVNENEKRLQQTVTRRCVY